MRGTWALSLFILTLLAAQTDTPHVYRNEEYGIAVAVPAGALLCPVPAEQHDHGPVFLIGTTDTVGCSEFEHKRTVVIFAGSNAVNATKRLHEFLKWECRNVANGPCGTAPQGVHIPGRPSEAAQVDHSSGWIDVIVVTQGGAPDSAFDATVPSINYELRLHTTRTHLHEDMRVFRKVLDTIQLPSVPSSPEGRE